MSESTQGIIVLVLTSVFVSFFVHALVPSFVAACFASAAIASIVFQFLAYLHIGYVDPFFVIALFTGGAAAFVVSLLNNRGQSKVSAYIPHALIHYVECE